MKKESEGYIKRKRLIGYCESGIVIRVKDIEIIQEHCENWFFHTKESTKLYEKLREGLAKDLASKIIFTQSTTANRRPTQNVVKTSFGGAIKGIVCGGY